MYKRMGIRVDCFHIRMLYKLFVLHTNDDDHAQRHSLGGRRAARGKEAALMGISGAGFWGFGHERGISAAVFALQNAISGCGHHTATHALVGDTGT